MRIRNATLFLSTALVLLAASVRADDHLPSAREIFDRFVETTNSEALADQPMRKVTGTFSIPAQGMSGPMVTYTKAPDLSYTEIELAGVGKIQAGYNGEVAWALDPLQGPQVMEGDALTQQKIMANFYGPLYREADIDSAGVVGTTDFKGEEVYEVTIVRDGIEATEYFSVESGLMVGGKATMHSPMGEIPVESESTDYADHAGVMIATKAVQSMMGMQQVITIDEVSAEEFDASVFDLPAEIAALVEE